VTIARTTGPDTHTDVCLWYLLAGSPALPVRLDPREFAGGRWWAGPQVESSSPALFDPDMRRFLAKVRATRG
jgi:8-oxo-dGTP diphosphatase